VPDPGQHPINAGLSAPVRRLARGLNAFLAALWATFLVAVVLGGLSPVPVGALSDVMVALVGWGTAASAVLRVALVRHQRAVWAPLALGMTSYALGAVVWTFWLEPLAEPPFPSIADALWLALYPLSFATIALTVRAEVGRLSASVWLDGLIGTLSVSALGVALLLVPLLRDATGSTAAVATNFAYPVGDVAVAAAVAGGFALTGWRLSRSWLLLATGFVAFTAADAVYLRELAAAAYVTQSVENLLWGGGLVLMARAAWSPIAPAAGGRERLGRPSRPRSRSPRSPCSSTTTRTGSTPSRSPWPRPPSRWRWCASCTRCARSARCSRASVRRARTSSPACPTGAPWAMSSTPRWASASVRLRWACW
jgi:hypothetical protein